MLSEARRAVSHNGQLVNRHGETFGAWLLVQKEREGLIGALVKAARDDRSFPKQGDPDEVRARLTAAGADGDMFEAVDDAEMDWMSY